jgi:hypothetical protein
MSSALSVFNAVAANLGIRTRAGVAPIDEFLFELLRALVVDRNIRQREDWPSVRAAAELLTVPVFSDDDIDRALVKYKPSWVDGGALRSRRESKIFRLFLGAWSQDRTRWPKDKVRKLQDSTWAPAMSQALHDYLVQNRTKAQEIAVQCGFELLDDHAQASESVHTSRAEARPSVESIRWPRLTCIARPVIETEFQRTVSQGAGLIALVGLAGMGKTSLARTLAPEAPFIEFSDSKPALHQLQAALRRFDVPVDDLTASNASSKLVDLLLTKQGPRFVILDNLQTTAQLRDLVPDGGNAIVVATCRESAGRLPFGWREIEVGPMQLDEAARLAMEHMPSLIFNDAKAVAEALGCYPLVIEAACNYALAGKADIFAVCRMLQNSSASVETRTGEQLRNVLGRSVASLRIHGNSTIELLSLILANRLDFDLNLNPFAVQICFLYLYGVERGLEGYFRGMLALEKFLSIKFEDVLVTLTGHVQLGPYHFTAVSIHPLVRSILCELLRNDIERTSAKVVELCRSWISEIESLPDDEVGADRREQVAIRLIMFESFHDDKTVRWQDYYA